VTSGKNSRVIVSPVTTPPMMAPVIKRLTGTGLVTPNRGMLTGSLPAPCARARR
jgi:hypothetical protein